MQIINLLSLFLVFSFVADVSCFFSDKINLISTKYQCCYCESENITALTQADTHTHTHSIIVVAGGAGLVT